MKKTVQVDGGVIKGYSGAKSNIAIFKGIPFATPPTGKNRWRMPQPVIPWDGVRVCDRFAPVPPQFIDKNSLDVKERKGVLPGEPNEDCLYLNVWTPANEEEEKLPVLFWIFGGGFVAGGTSAPEFDGEGLAGKGIIVVTAAYRLGPLGFMAHPQLSAESEYGISGNYGIWDLIAALKWTRNNIGKFGGDPDKITIGGHSAGGGCAHALCCAPQTKGMFRRALLQHSGGIRENLFLRYRTLEEAHEIGARTLDLLDVPTIEEARALPWQWIFEKSFQVPVRENMPNMPVIDGVILRRSLTDTVLQNEHHDVDYMVGHTVPGNVLPIKVDISDNVEAFRSEAREFYGDWADEFLRICGADNPEKISRYKQKRYTENLVSGDVNFCEAQERLGRRPAYLWEFRHTLPGDDIGTYVGSEHWYLFDNLGKNWRPFEDYDKFLSGVMSDYWSNFVKTGNPNSEGMPIWMPYVPYAKNCMEFGDEVKLQVLKTDDMLNFRRDFVLRKLI